MKKLICSIAATLAVAATVYAGTTTDKTVVTPAANDIGSGFYVGAQGGLNLAQDNIDTFGLDAKKKLGWDAGLKLGYVAGGAQDLVRPALELEGLYTAFDRHLDGYGDPNFTAKMQTRTFAYMANGIAKFNLGSFQPYVGAGAGFFSMKAKTAVSVDNSGEFDTGSNSRDGFAWQLLAGVDYYVTPTVSVFTEYQWLNCLIRNRDDFTGCGRLGQQLVSAGVRFHF